MEEESPLHRPDGDDVDEQSDLLSDYSSDTSFYDDRTAMSDAKENWTFVPYRKDGRVSILGEWLSKSKSHRYCVIGPDWPCAIITYLMVIVPSIIVYFYLVESQLEEIIFLSLLALCLFGLSTVFLTDPGLVRRYHHARSRHWTYCDTCESFRPPGTVHCSTCQVCIVGYDHHCPVSLVSFSLLYCILSSFCFFSGPENALVLETCSILKYS